MVLMCRKCARKYAWALYVIAAVLVAPRTRLAGLHTLRAERDDSAIGPERSQRPWSF